jgi:hypothetical protein
MRLTALVGEEKAERAVRLAHEFSARATGQV